MTEMQKRMQELISKEALDRAFDARFPKEMQEKLRAAKVAVAGLGGLGSNIAVMLARSGIGKLLLVDFDVVDVTNLNRQRYFIPQLGKPKTEALTGRTRKQCWYGSFSFGVRRRQSYQETEWQDMQIQTRSERSR